MLLHNLVYATLHFVLFCCTVFHQIILYCRITRHMASVSSQISFTENIVWWMTSNLSFYMTLFLLALNHINLSTTYHVEKWYWLIYFTTVYHICIYIYMSLRKWIWIKTCLQDSRSPPELLFRFFDGSSSCKWTFLPVRWKLFAPQNQKLTPLTKGVLQVFIILEFFALSFSRIFQCVTFELVVST